MTNLPKIDEGVFYITNACNLTCERCLSFNNRKFKGHFLWNDYKEDYTAWGRKLFINGITIIGGEPFANPDLINWVNGIKEIWPTCPDISVCTNGTYLKTHYNLAKEILKAGYWLDISCHDPKYYEEFDEIVKQLIKDCFGKTIHSVSNNNRNLWVDETISTYNVDNKKIAAITKSYIFSNVAERVVKNNITYMYNNSDIVRAHNNCGPKFCHYFVKGKLYKCYLTAVAEDLMSQFSIDEKAAEVLKKYKACSPYESLETIDKFVENLAHPIEQCSLCPEKTNNKPIWPLALKKENY